MTIVAHSPSLKLPLSPSLSSSPSLLGQWVWKFRTIYNQKVLEPQFPKCIHSVFTEAPSSIDAAFEKDGKLHILKDYQVWKYDSQSLRLVFGYPQR